MYDIQSNIISFFCVSKIALNSANTVQSPYGAVCQSHSDGMCYKLSANRCRHNMCSLQISGSLNERLFSTQEWAIK